MTNKPVADLGTIANMLGGSKPKAGGFTCTCPNHDDRKASLHLDYAGADGRPSAYCYVCDDAKAVYAAIEEKTGHQIRGREKEATKTKKPKAYRAIMPAPIPWPDDIKHNVHGRPSKTWFYYDENGGLMMAVCRFETADGKRMAQASAGPNRTGQITWNWKVGTYEHRKLYNLQALIARPDAIVLVVEGEKAADAAQEIYPDYVVTTYPMGAQAWKRADWRPLQGRDVILWPDHDEPGRKQFRELAAMLNSGGMASRVRVAHVPENWPEKWDLADDVPTSLNQVEFKDAHKPSFKASFNTITEASFMGVFTDRYYLMRDTHAGRNFTVDRQRLATMHGVRWEPRHLELINPNHNSYGIGKVDKVDYINFWAKEQSREDNELAGHVFEPGLGEIIETSEGRFLNSFTGWAFEPKEQGCPKFIAYLREIIAANDAGAFDYIASYLAHMFQKPGERVKTAIVFSGDPGTGKSFLGHTIYTLLGGDRGYGAKVGTIDRVIGKFNSLLESNLMCWVDEIEAVRNTTQQNNFKNMVVDEHITIERKGVDAQRVRNLTRFMGSSNHSKVLNIDETDRRFSIFEVSDKRKRDAKYFAGLQEELDNGGYAALMHFLMTYQINQPLINEPFGNYARKVQVNQNQSPNKVWIYEILKAGYLDFKIVAEGAHGKKLLFSSEIHHLSWQSQEVFLPCKVAQLMIDDIMKRPAFMNENYTERDRRKSAQYIVKALGGRITMHKDVLINGRDETARVFVFPPLGQMRENYSALTGIDTSDLFGEQDDDISYGDNVIPF